MRVNLFAPLALKFTHAKSHKDGFCFFAKFQRLFGDKTFLSGELIFIEKAMSCHLSFIFLCHFEPFAKRRPNGLQGVAESICHIERMRNIQRILDKL